MRLISTFVATIIIVLITVGIGILIYSWASGYLRGNIETAIGTQELIVECTQVNLDVDYYKNFKYRIPITIKENSGKNLTDYQVLITLDTASLISAGKMKSDCGDIRFTDSDGTTLLNYWIESGCNSTNTRIWVKVPNIPASGTKIIYVYYGNPSATSLSNGDLVFDFFDDFRNANSINTSKWVISAGTSNDVIAVGSGYLRIYSDGTSPVKTIQSLNAVIGINSVFETVGTLISIDNAHLSWGFMDSNQADGNGYWPFYTSGNIYRDYKRTPGAWTLLGTGGSYTAGTYQRHVVIRQNTNFKFYVDGTLVFDRTITEVSNKNLYLIAPRIWNENTGDIGEIRYLFVLVRKYTSPEPTYTLGNEEFLLKLLLTNLGANLGKQYLVKINYEDGNVITQNIT
ncbi:MAG: DUF2341 domain-containing protein, partial [Candidatus Aenigmatarchaeota archaeon]